MIHTIYHFTGFSVCALLHTLYCNGVIFVKQAVSNGSCSSNSALRNNNQHDPSCFTRLTSSLEDDLTRRQKRLRQRRGRCPPPETYLKFERLHIVGARSEVSVDQSATTERSAVRVLLQSHAVSLAVPAVQALSVAT